MANTTETARAIVDLDGKAAGEELKTLKKRATELRKELKEIKLSGDKSGYETKKRELDAINKKTDQAKKATWDLQRVMSSLNGTSLKDLERAQRQLTNEIRNSSRATLEEKRILQEKASQLAAVKAQITQVKLETGLANKQNKSFFGGMSDGFNRYFGLATAFVASITGVVLGFRKLANEVAAMDDVYSDVMKTTGKTREEVIKMNEVFKQMDTRTARESINYLARDAGKLGLTATKDILDFVEAGNQINVALGEDLGDDAIKQIGKMVGVYKDASIELQGLGLKEQMLSVGSAVNQLGASSTASEPYLVAFTGRLGGIAKQAGISMSAILGFGSALDQDMQAVEMSATALQKFIMKIMGDPAKFAKIAGLEVKGFTDLLNTDANAAIIKILKSLNEKGGFQELIPIFQDMGMDGARAVGVLSSMAGSIDKVTEAQRIANQAMVEGTSVTNEYNIKNENLQARLEKAQKNFKESALILGEQLAPALVFSTNSLSYLIKAIVGAPAFFKKYDVVIIALVGSLLAMQSIKIKLFASSMAEHLMLKTGIGLRVKEAIQLKLLIIQEQYRLALIGKTTVAQKAAAIATTTLKTAMAALGGPIGLAILAVTGLIAAIKLYDKYNAESARLDSLKLLRIRETASANKIIEDRYAAQQTQIQGLNKLNGDQISKLEQLTLSTIKQAEAELLLAKTRRTLTLQENTKTSLWQDVKNMALYGASPALLIANTLEDAANSGAEAAASMDENIQKLGESISQFKDQHQQLIDITKAESNADAINATTKSQLEEKARLLGVALKNVVIDSEDYVRISNKLEEVNKKLNKSTKDNASGNGELAGSYVLLSQAIDYYKKQLTEMVAKGNLGEAVITGETLARLEAAKKYVDEIIAANGDLEKVIDKVRNAFTDEALANAKNDPDGLIDDTMAYLDANTEPVDLDMQTVKQKTKFDKDFYLDSVTSASNAAFDIWRNNSDARLEYELSNLNRAMESELKNKNLTEEQKDAIRARYAKKERKLKEDAFKKQKAADVIQSVIKTALAVVNQLSGGDPISAIPRSIAAGIAGLAETAVIISQPMPKFYGGGATGPGLGINDGQGTVAGVVHANEYVIPEWMRGLPQVIAFERVLEGIRTRNGFAKGGQVAAPQASLAAASPAGNNTVITTDPALISVITRLNENIERGIKAKLSLMDLEEFQEKKQAIEELSAW